MTALPEQRSHPVARSGPPIGIVCGGGTVPFAVADGALGDRRIVLFALRGVADPKRVAAYPHHWIRFCEIGRLCRLARKEGCRELVFIGLQQRPKLREMRIDVLTWQLLPRLIRLFHGGDAHLLEGVIKIFEEQGFTVLGSHELAPSILIPPGPAGRNVPNERNLADIARGIALLHATGPYDVGQAVVVASNQILAVEAAEGTDAMLARVAEMRRIGRIPAAGGVLIKAPKPQQDLRIDLPTIGPKTVEGALRAKLDGIAAVAGGSILAEPARVADMANRDNLFVVGIDPDGSIR
ncbi:MAG: UDP-2,3-diacylglucosamine diphosphatase LpxI [Xanthobacteraceae bacterium]